MVAYSPGHPGVGQSYRFWESSVDPWCEPHTRERKTSMPRGTVIWFNTNKGFGFIKPDNGDKDVFVHIRAMEEAKLGGLKRGEKISYEVFNDRGKAWAINLQRPPKQVFIPLRNR